MNRLIQIINEEISAIRKDKDKEIFNYSSIVNDAWRDKIHEAQKFQRINFDLENDDSTGEKKTIYIKKNLRKDQPIKYEFNVELCEAGGDWEMPVMYFKLEISHDYGVVKSDEWKENHKPEYIWDLDGNYSGLYHCYVIIPPVEAGNKIQKKQGEGSTGGSDKYDWFAYENGELSREEEKKIRITDADKKNCWMWLEKLLEKVVNQRHKMLD